MQATESSEIDATIRFCDGAFIAPVAQRAIYPNLMEKIHQKGKFIFAYDSNPLGYCAFYANDAERRTAYISLIAVLPEYQKMHIGTELLKKSFEMMRTYGMEHCMLEVRKNNKNAIQFYKKNQFVVEEEHLKSYLMRCEL